jgi:two-component system sensor histidine kinase TtrS
VISSNLRAVQRDSAARLTLVNGAGRQQPDNERLTVKLHRPVDPESSHDAESLPARRVRARQKLAVSRAARALATACLAGEILLAGIGAAQAGTVSVGVFAWQDERATISEWASVIDALNHALPESHFELYRYDAAGLRQALAEHRLDMLITSPGNYVAMEGELGLSRIATLASPNVSSPAQAIGSAVFVRAQREDLPDLSALAGKRVAAVGPDAFAGYLVAARELKRLGIDPETDVRMSFVGLPMTAVVDAVRRGEADAGVVRTCVLERLVAEKRLDARELRVLSPRQQQGFDCTLSTQLYPDWPIAVTRETDPALAKAVARVLLAMPEGQGRVSWAVPADYQTVHDLYRELRVGPYASLRQLTPAGLARRYWPWLVAASGLLLAWFIHTLRVEQQVRQRTAQLRESLTAREAAEVRTRESQERMEHLSRLSILGELSGNLAHEINQPLATIGTYARALLRRQASGSLTPAALADACTEIAAESERAGGIVQRIRHFARKRSAVREPVRLGALAGDARRLLIGLLAQPPEIVIEDRVPGGCDVLADGPQIQQVLLNLIKNAIDATRGMPSDRQQISVIIEQAADRVVAHVSDCGAGLEPAQRDRLFEPFFTTKPDGLGLGLPICKTIIEAHGGRLWAEPNADGPGLRFSFSLPCHEIRA